MKRIISAALVYLFGVTINGAVFAANNCTGATYYDANNDTCVACPTGYTDNTAPQKTAASQCQRSCAAGEFVATPATVGSSAYTRLEYIENPNGKLINTNFSHPTTVTTVHGVLRVGVSTDLPNNSNVNFIGNQASGGGYSVGWNAYFKLWTVSSNNRLEGPAYAMTAGTVHQIEYEITNSKRKLIYDTGWEGEQTYNKNGTGKAFSPATTIHLFDAGNNQAARSFKGRIYDLKIYEDGVLVHNIVAARRNSDNKIGMYDIETDTFLEGSGKFTAGPDAGGCSNVGIGYYSGASMTDYGSTSSRSLCTNGPAHTHYTGSATSNSCPYDCDANYVMESNTNTCEFQEQFTVTTTADATQLLFDLATIGTYYVDCGTDGTLVQNEYSGDNNAAGTVITRTLTTKQSYTCSWPTAGVHTVKFAGTTTSYNTTATQPAISFSSTTATTANKIASVTGSLSAIFPQKGTTNGQFPRFYQTFKNATNLTSVPAGLFTGITGNVNASNMFRETFIGCTSLNTIPAGLFTGVTTGATDMFRSTFQGCTSLTAIPVDLFSGMTTAADGLFRNTFYGATHLTGYVPPTTFAGLIANTSPTATDMWTGTFTNTAVATTCPTGLDEYPTGYENEWGGRVSCYVACPNTPPTNSTWSVINNNCVWLCDAGYYSADGTSCTAVDTGYYSGDGDNAQTACTNKPANSHYTGSATTDDCPWQCDTGYGSDAGTCRACTASEFLTSGGICVTTKFTVTTTNSTSEFKFFMWEPTGTFYVDWGDGTGETITRTSSTGNTYSHIYASTGSYTIRFGGVATGYDGNSSHTAISFYSATGGTQDKIASVSGSLASLFPTPNDTALPFFRETFRGATNLTTVPNTLFDGITRTHGHMFYHTFDGAGLTAIPYDLFADVGSLGVGMFEYTFANCTALTAIPSGLFDNMTTSGAVDNMFEGTFTGCTSLTTIPTGLFDDFIDSSSNWTRLSSASTGGVFRDTFSGCTSLTSAPAELFSGMTITGIPNMFANTFRNCSSLAAIPTGLFDDITVSGAAFNMFEYTFAGCTSLTTIPSDLFDDVISGAANGTDQTGWFKDTFNGCTGLTAMPAGLFSGITTATASLFDGTFYGCSNLAGYIPPTTFAGLIINDTTKNTNMWNNTFSGTSLLTSCASVSRAQYITGYEGSTNGTTWNGRVSCGGCAAGNYETVGGTCTACTGATYNDIVGAASCKSCPTGYNYNTTSGKAAITACQIHCDGGSYVGELASGYTMLEYIETTGTQYINTGIAVNSMTNPIMAIDMQYTSTATSQQNGVAMSAQAVGTDRHFKIGISKSSSTFIIQAGGQNTHISFGAADTNRHTFVLNTANSTGAIDNEVRPLNIDDLSAYSYSIYLGRTNASDYVSSAKYYGFSLISNGVEIMHLVPARRINDSVVGMYDMVTGTFFTNAGTGTFGAGSAVGGGQCTDVGVGYYAAASATNFGSAGSRTACATGLTTIGYGHGADEAGDCGRVFNIGDYQIYSRSVRATTPSLNFKTADNQVFYISTSSSNHSLSPLHIGNGTTQYTAYDDSLFYAERPVSGGE